MTISQLGVKSWARIFDRRECDYKKVRTNKREIKKALNENHAAKSLYQEALEEEYAKIKKKIDKQKNNKNTFSAWKGT